MCVFGCLFLDNLKLAYSLRNTYWCTVPQRFLLACKTLGHQGLDYEEKSSHSAQVYGLWVVYKLSYPQHLFHRTQAVNLELEKFYRPLVLSTLISLLFHDNSYESFHHSVLGIMVWFPKDFYLHTNKRCVRDLAVGKNSNIASQFTGSGSAIGRLIHTVCSTEFRLQLEWKPWIRL